MIRLQSILTFIKKPSFILILIIVVFLIKGIFFATLLPFLQGFDEEQHYTTVQFLAEPEEKNWTITKESPKQPEDYFKLYEFHMAEEVINAAELFDFPGVKDSAINTQKFSQGYFGADEQKILSMPWKKYVDIYPVYTVDYSPLYYKFVSYLIRALWESDFLVRFFVARFASVFVGAIIVMLVYAIARKMDFSKKISLIMTAIISFHPIFGQTAATVNADIVLTLGFSIFLYGAIAMLTDNPNWKNIIVSLLGLYIGITAKPTGIALVPIAAIFFLYFFKKKFNLGRLKFALLFISGCLLVFFIIKIFPIFNIFMSALSHQESKFPNILMSFSQYLLATAKRLPSMSLSYWGNFGWKNAPISDLVLSVVWPLELVSTIGIISFYRKKDAPKDFLPKRKYIIIMLMMLCSLQFFVRYADWKYFDLYGAIVIGTMGRYFIPNIIPHILLAIFGIGCLLKNNLRFERFLKLILALMVFLQIYAIFNIIIPRYYL